MRVTRAKRVRRLLRFYKVSHGFRAPWKVLVDGNFVHALLSLKLGEPAHALERFLGEAVRAFTTRAAGAELRRLGAEFAAAAAATKRLHLAPEDKDAGGGAASGAEAAEAVVGAANAGRYAVATQDEALRRRLRALHCVPLLFVTASGVSLEPPGEEAKRAAAQADEAAQRVPDHERRAREAAEAAALHPKRKHRGPKQPNPLSVRKKALKKPPRDAAAAAAAAGGDGDDAPRARQKRPRRKAKQQEGSPGDA